MEILGALPFPLLGTLIFLCRVADVSLGTIRTIAIVQGRTRSAFVLGFFEVTIWFLAISTVVHLVNERPVLILFYALGFATGNVVGIRLERWLASGNSVLRIFTDQRGRELADRMREQGFAVTVFTGEGLKGPVVELYVVCRRRDQPHLLAMMREVDPEAFHIMERAGSVSKVIRPFMPPRTGWRAILKKK